MSICSVKTAVPFAALSESQTAVQVDSNTFYEATLRIVTPANRDYLLEVNSISVDFNIFIDPTTSVVDPTETVTVKIVSLGVTVLDRALNSAELCALFANNNQNDTESLVATNTWNVLAQGCAITLGLPNDVVEIKTHTKNNGQGVEECPISARGCYRAKHEIGCANRVPFVEISPAMTINVDGNTETESTQVVAKCSAGSRVVVNRIILPAAERFCTNNLTNNFSLTLKSSALTTFTGNITAINASILVPFFEVHDFESNTVCNFSVWDFSCPLILKCCGDIIDVKVTDSRAIDEPYPCVFSQLPIV